MTLGSEMENKTQTNSLRIIHIIASECFNDSIKKSYLRIVFNSQGYKHAVNKYIVKHHRKVLTERLKETIYRGTLGIYNIE